jgi:hypothetical protein
MAYGLAFQNYSQHVTLCNLTCSDMHFFGLDFISHAEQKNAEDAFNHLVRCSTYAAAAVIFLFFGWMVMVMVMMMLLGASASDTSRGELRRAEPESALGLRVGAGPTRRGEGRGGEGGGVYPFPPTEPA